MRRALLYAVPGLALLLGLCVALGLGEFRRALENASAPRFAAFLLASGSVLGVYALRWRVVLRFLGARPSFAALVGFRVSGHLVASLIPSAQLGGDPLRAFLLRRHGLDWTTALLGVGIDRLLEMTASAVAGPVYVAIFLRATGGSFRSAGWVLAAMAAGLLGVLAVYWSATSRRGLVAVLVRRGVLASVPVAAAQERVSAFLRSRWFALALLLSFLVEALLVTEIWLLTRAFGIEVPLYAIGGLLIGMGIAHLTPVPGALGSLEAAQVGVIRLAGGAADVGLAVGLLVRLREALWILAGAGALYAQGFSSATTPGKSGHAVGE